MSINKNNNFLTYIESTFSDEIFNRLTSYVIKNRYPLIIDKYDLIRAEDIEIYDLGFKSVSIEAKDNDFIEFDLYLNPEITYVEVTGKYRDRESSGTNSLWFTITCSGKIGSSLEQFKILYIDEFNKTKKAKPLNGDLVPIISKQDYERVAKDILDAYYPEYLKNDDPIDIEKIVKRMGYSLCCRSISDKQNIFGQTYFDECEVSLYNSTEDKNEVVIVPANTIMIDKEANNAFSYGCINITIAHECIHAFLHKRAFKFARLYNPGLKGVISCTSKGNIHNLCNGDNSKFIEIQANAIAPVLLLPKAKILREYESLERIYSSFTSDRLQRLELIIRDLASKFNVTLYAVKKRLFDLGYEDALGVLNYVDGTRIPIRPFSFKKGSLLHNETYVISFVDFLKMMQENSSSLFTALIQKQYVFVENHICINDSKFIKYNEHGRQILTEYARYHIDECCIKFKCSSKKLINDGDALMYCYLSREVNTDLGLDISVANSPNITDKHVSSNLKDFVDDMTAMRSKIRGLSFGKAVKTIMEYKHIQLNEITELVSDKDSLHVRQVQRYLNDEVKQINPRIIVAIILTLKVSPIIASELINVSGVNLKPNDPEDNLLLSLLFIGNGKKFEEINQMLLDAGYESLTKTEE